MSTKLRIGDRVRICAPMSTQHHVVGKVEKIQGGGTTETVIIRSERGHIIWAQPDSLILLAGPSGLAAE